jgi:citrate synthase
MDDCKIILNTGLRGVKIAQTRISEVDGDAGRLIYRGYTIQDLASHASFEEVAYLLLFEKLPSQAELLDFKGQLSREREVHPDLIAALKTRPAGALAMDVLQAAVAMLANHDPELPQSTQDGTVRMAIRLIAKTATLVAAWHRIRHGLEPVPPDPLLDHAANFLYMLKKEAPDPEIARFLDVCLVLHAEHSFNASTFAAREVASTRAHMYAAVSAAIGSLSGELHGGANARVMDMLIKIGTPDAVESFVQTEFAAGRKIMGLGHAVYNVDDPRAFILAPMSKTMGEKIGDTRWYDISRLLETRAKAAFNQRKGMDIVVNVDFYSASLYYAMGIPLDLFTPVFAVSRVAGWVAHVIEEQYAGASSKPVLYRPESEYVGDYCGPETCAFTPIEKRASKGL